MSRIKKIDRIASRGLKGVLDIISSTVLPEPVWMSACRPTDPS